MVAEAEIDHEEESTTQDELGEGREVSAPVEGDLESYFVSL